MNKKDFSSALSPLARRKNSSRRSLLFCDKRLLIQEARIRWNLLSVPAKILVTMLALAVALHILLAIIDRLYYGNSNNMRNDAAAPMQLSAMTTSFAVVINTYKRPDMLRKAVQHYGETCGRQMGVSQVFVVWAELNETPPTPDKLFGTNNGNLKSSSSTTKTRKEKDRSQVTVIRVPKDSLNSRFLPISSLQSAAVFMVDDDIRVDCQSLYKGFQAWRAHPQAMVGYYPRLAAAAASSKKSTTTTATTSSSRTYVYQAWPIVWWRHRMNFVLTKASFFHAKYLALYSDAAKHPVEILDYVDQHMNCEDVAMSLLVANATMTTTTTPAARQRNSVAPPLLSAIYVQGSAVDDGLFGGISTKSGHMDARSQCLNDLTAIYQKHGWSPPLDPVFTLRESSWDQHLTKWQYRPSNPFEWAALDNIFK